MTKDTKSFHQEQLGFRMTDELLIYKTPDTEVRVEILIHDENLWLTQDKIAQLFGVQRPAITKHLNNIFAEGELEKEAVCSKMEHTASDGKTYQTNFFGILEDKGERTAAQAKAHAMREFDAYHSCVLKEHQSDFDMFNGDGFDDLDSRIESN